MNNALKKFALLSKEKEVLTLRKDEIIREFNESEETKMNRELISLCASYLKQKEEYNESKKLLETNLTKFNKTIFKMLLLALIIGSFINLFCDIIWIGSVIGSLGSTITFLKFYHDNKKIISIASETDENKLNNLINTTKEKELSNTKVRNIKFNDNYKEIAQIEKRLAEINITINELLKNIKNDYKKYGSNEILGENYFSKTLRLKR